MSLATPANTKVKTRKRTVTTVATASEAPVPTVQFDDDTEDEKKVVTKVTGDCPICCSPYTAQLRKPVKCLYCEADCCSKCVRQYLLSKADSHCMQCRKVWTKDFLKKHFSRTFIREGLPEHYGNVLAELEKSLFPDTMQQVEEERLRLLARDAERNAEEFVRLSDSAQATLRHLNSLKLSQTFTDRHALVRFPSAYGYRSVPQFAVSRDEGEVSLRSVSVLNQYMKIVEDMSSTNLDHFNKRLPDISMTMCSVSNRQVFFLDDCIKLFTALQTKIEGILSSQLAMTDTVKHREDFKAIRCVREKCPGYLTQISANTTRGVCKVCDTIACSECLVDGVAEDHKCDPDLLKTIKLIQKDSKPCPNCKANVSRISGCPQMFCVSCNTPFDWDTNQIITGRVHNPHYFEWLNKQPQQQPRENRENRTTQPPNDCTDNAMFTNTLYSTLSDCIKAYSTNKLYAKCSYLKLNAIRQAYQVFTHIQAQEMPTVNMNPRTRYQQLRIDFLSGKISEESWRKQLTAKMIQHDNAVDLAQLFQAVVMIAWNIYQQFVNDFVDINAQTVSMDAKLADVTKIVDQAYESLVNACRYFNEHSRILFYDRNLTRCYKLFVPDLSYPLSFDPTSNIPMYTTLRSEHKFVLETSAPLLMEGETDFRINTKNVKDIEHSEEEKTILDWQKQINAIVQPCSESFRELTCFTQIDHDRLQFAVWDDTAKHVQKVINSACELTKVSAMYNLVKQVEEWKVMCKKKKKRFEIIEMANESIQDTIGQILSSFRALMVTLAKCYSFFRDRDHIINMYGVPKLKAYFVGSRRSRETRIRHRLLNLSNSQIITAQTLLRNLSIRIPAPYVNPVHATGGASSSLRLTESVPSAINADARQPNCSDADQLLIQKAFTMFCAEYNKKTLCLEPWFETVTVEEHRVTLPKWLTFLFTSNPKETCFFADWHQTSTAHRHLSPCRHLYDSSIFSCFIDGQSVHMVEALLFPFVCLPASEWDYKVPIKMERRLTNLYKEYDISNEHTKAYQIPFVHPTFTQVFVERMITLYSSNAFDLANFEHVQSLLPPQGQKTNLQYKLATLCPFVTIIFVSLFMRKHKLA